MFILGDRYVPVVSEKLPTIRPQVGLISLNMIFGNAITSPHRSSGPDRSAGNCLRHR